MALIIWKRGDHKPLSNFFNTKEFECQCKFDDCIDQAISEDLLGKLNNVRIQVNMPLKINSGFRCSKHQQELRESGIQTASGKSQHELGEAADITSQMPIDDFTKICEKYFMAVGEAKTWCHVDTRGGMRRRWTYK